MDGGGSERGRHHSLAEEGWPRARTGPWTTRRRAAPVEGSHRSSGIEIVAPGREQGGGAFTGGRTAVCGGRTVVGWSEGGPGGGGSGLVGSEGQKMAGDGEGVFLVGEEEGDEWGRTHGRHKGAVVACGGWRMQLPEAIQRWIGPRVVELESKLQTRRVELDNGGGIRLVGWPMEMMVEA